MAAGNRLSCVVRDGHRVLAPSTALTEPAKRQLDAPGSVLLDWLLGGSDPSAVAGFLTREGAIL